MEQDFLVSVIVPVYNVIDYLERCVDSICRQTYKNLEIILVDDGSTDGTNKLCDKLGLDDERIMVYHKKNGGSSSARNFGIKKARGEYLGFIDSDDYIDENMFELLVDAIKKYNVSIAQVGRDEIDVNGEKRPDVCIPPTKTTWIPNDMFMKELLMHRGDCSFCTKLVKKELFSMHFFPEGILNEDFYLLTNMLPNISGIVSIPNQTYHVFYRIGSNTRKKTESEFSRAYVDSVDNAVMVQKIVENSFPELQKVGIRFNLYQRMEYLLHIPIGQMTRNNIEYRKIVSYLRKNIHSTLFNPFLTGKNKLYLVAFTIAPKVVRKSHRFLKKIRNKKL